MTHSESRERNALIVADVKAGVPRDVLCKKYGVTVDTIVRVTYRAGERLPRQVRTASYAVIARLINTPDSYASIGRDMNVAFQSVYAVAKKCRKHGIQLHPSRTRTNGDLTL